MITVTFEILNEGQVDSSFEKEFRNRPELYHYLKTHDGHPFLSLRIQNISGEEESQDV